MVDIKSLKMCFEETVYGSEHKWDEICSLIFRYMFLIILF